MKLYVIDASVAVKWFIVDTENETHVDRALRLLASGQAGALRFLQPPHWVSEMAAVLVRLAPKTASASVDALMALEFVETVTHLEHYQRAISLAIKLDHHLFDTHYHAIALAKKATLVTADRKYFNKARSLGSVMLLEDFEG